MRTFGGAEVWFLDTARHLQDRGLAVSIIMQPDALWLPQVRAAHIPHKTIALRCDGAPWTWIKLARWFHDTGVTAIVANRTKDLKACGVAGRLAGVPVILGTRESDFPLKDKPYYRFYFNTLASGLLVNSKATRNTVLASAPWLKPEQVHLLYKGIDTGHFTPAAEAPASPVVGFVGQLIVRKGLRDLMVAWSQLETRSWPPDRQPRLRLAGNGPLAEELRKWRAGLTHPHLVELTGFCRDIRAFYRELTILVLPSHAEGFGLAAAEASACSLPVIASNTSSLPEIIVDHLTGLLIPPHNPQALQEAMTRLCLDPLLCQNMGRAGREFIEANFALDQSLDQLVNLTHNQ